MNVLIFAEHKAMAEFFVDIGKTINPDIIFGRPEYTPSVQTFKKGITGKRIFNQAKVFDKIIALLDTDCREENEVESVVTSNWPQMQPNVILIPFKCELETLFYYFQDEAVGAFEELFRNNEVVRFIQNNRSMPFNFRKPSERLEQLGYQASKHLPIIANVIKENPLILETLCNHPGFQRFREAILS